MLQWSLPPCVLLSQFAPASSWKPCWVVAPVAPCRALESSEGTSSGPRLESYSLPLSNQLSLCFRCIHIGGSGPGEHHGQHHAAGGHQHHRPQHHHVGLGQEEQEHQHAVPHGWCPRRNDHAPAARLLPAAARRRRELRPHGSPRHHVVPHPAGPGGKAALSLGLHRWARGWGTQQAVFTSYDSAHPVLKNLYLCWNNLCLHKLCTMRLTCFCLSLAKANPEITDWCGGG